MESIQPFEETAVQTLPPCQNLLVGNEPCTYSAICDKLKSSSSTENLWDKLDEVARSLQYSEELVGLMMPSLLSKFTTHYSLLHDILKHWRGKVSDKATLHALMDCFESKGLNGCAAALRQKFCTCSQNSTLQIHAGSFKHIAGVLNTQISFQGTITALKDILKELRDSSLKKVLNMYNMEVSDSQILIKNTLPEVVKYYVPRRLTSRNHLDSSVFKAKCSDIFVVKRIQMHELSILANGQGTDLSGNQIEDLTVRFILLEHKSDYPRICKLSFGKPVHLITYDQGKFIWIKTQGSLSALKDYIDLDQTEWNESQFVSTCLKSTTPICIADTPGMGKTMLLVSIGRQILELQPHRLVIFIVLREMVPKVHKKRCASHVRTLIKLFAHQVSDSEFGRNVVTELFNCETQVIELMLDGLDEVLLNQLSVAKFMLKTISQLPSVRLYVSTRPHLRDELENTVGALGFNLQPFGKDEQVEFLTKYWVNESGASLNKKLIEFSKQCLDKLMSNMNDFEREIAGIPLQCSLLAEVYENSALKYSDEKDKLTNFDTGVQINIKSIFEMYSKLMEIRFKRLENLDDKRIWDNVGFLRQYSFEKRQSFFRKAHMRAALELIFPSEANLFSSLQNGDIETYHICSLGIMEKRDSGNESPRFVHRTFAEYYIGLLVVEVLANPKFLSKLSTDMKQECVKFCIFGVLDSFIEKVENPLSPAIWGDVDPIRYSRFHYPVICYFVNSHLKKYSVENIWMAEFIFYILTEEENVYNILEASASHDFSEIFNYISVYFSVEYPTKHLPPRIRGFFPKTQKTLKLSKDTARLSNILFVATKMAGLELVQIAYNFCDKNILSVLSKSIDFLVTPLHVAVERGHYKITEYLVNTLNNLKHLKYIMHCCVARSGSDSKNVLFYKTQIIPLLANANKNWLDEKLLDGTTPMLQEMVHESLITALLKCGANVNARKKNGSTALLQILGHGNSFNVDLIQQMEKKEMKLRSTEASQALKCLICNTSMMTGELDPVDFVNVADYLIEKGAVLTTEAGVTPWDLEVTKRNIEIISPLTDCNADLYSELKKRGVETIENGRPDALYFNLKTSPLNTFELVLISLVSCNQKKPFRILKQCLQTTTQGETIFFTPPNGIPEFMDSKQRNLVILRSWNIELTITRLRNTIHPGLVVINKHNRNTEGQYSSLWVYNFKFANLEIIQMVSSKLERKTICLCNEISRELEDSDEYQILWDEFKWSDLTTEFQKLMVSFSIPARTEAGYELNQQVSKLTDSNLVDLIVQHSKLEMTRILESYRNEYLERNPTPMNWYSSELLVTPLHVAAKSGHYNIVKYILNLQNESETKEPKYVVHCCVAETINEEERIISQKLKIIELISNKKRHWLEECLRDKRTPLMSPNTHKTLIYQLMELGVDINFVSREGSVLHSLAKYVKESELYDEIFVHLLKYGFNQFNSQDHNLKTAIHEVMANFECSSSTLQLFGQYKANFNLCDNYKDSVLFYAVAHQRPVAILTTLETLGADLKHTNSQNENVLHICVKYENYEGLVHFLKSPKIGKKEVEAENRKSETPFICGLRYGKGMDLSSVNMMIKKGLVINKVVSSVALKCLIRNENIVKPEATSDFVQIADFLLNQGGVITYLTGRKGSFRSPWELFEVHKILHEVSETTRCSQMLLEELHKRGVLRKHEFKTFFGKPMSLYGKLKGENSKGTFEKLCLSLLICGQFEPFLLLQQCV